MVVLRAIFTIISCDVLAALAAKVTVEPCANPLSSSRHANVTETPSLAGVWRGVS
jgi:hypothetical protein